MSQTCSTRSSAFIFLLVYLIYEASLMPIGWGFSTRLSEGKKLFLEQKSLCLLSSVLLFTRQRPTQNVYSLHKDSVLSLCHILKYQSVVYVTQISPEHISLLIFAFNKSHSLIFTFFGKPILILKQKAQQ